MAREYFSKEFFEKETKVVGKIAAKEKRGQKPEEVKEKRTKPTPEDLKAARERMARGMEEFLKLKSEEIKRRAEAEGRELTPEEIEIMRKKEMKEEMEKKLKAVEKYGIYGEAMVEEIGEEMERSRKERYSDSGRRGHRKGFKPPKAERETIREEAEKEKAA